MLREASLVLLGVTHWIAVIYFATYAFWPKRWISKTTDIVFLGLFALMVVHWYVFGTCIITILEKRLLYGTGTACEGDCLVRYLHPSLYFYKSEWGHSVWYALFMSLVNLMYFAGVLLVLIRLRVNKAIVIVIGILLMYILTPDRMRHWLWLMNDG